MFRKKRLNVMLIAAAAAVTVLFTAACGSGGSKVTVDVDKLADDLNSSVITSDTLTETNSEMLSGIYFFEDGQVVNSKVYMSGNATADEICVVECKDEDTASDVKELLQNRVDTQAELFASYNPDEAAKLNDAIVESSGKYAILIVCDDYDKAREILKDDGFDS